MSCRAKEINSNPQICNTFEFDSHSNVYVHVHMYKPYICGNYERNNYQQNN